MSVCVSAFQVILLALFCAPAYFAELSKGNAATGLFRIYINMSARIIFGINYLSNLTVNTIITHKFDWKHEVCDDIG